MSLLTPSLTLSYVLGKVIDLTVSQFDGIIPNYEVGEERTRDYLLSNEDTKNRYYMKYSK